jgi:hypothetical protein
MWLKQVLYGVDNNELLKIWGLGLEKKKNHLAF